MRQARFTGGRYYDELMMGILRDEFLEKEKGRG
jgi:RimJ/RimL family protein N-acetyltransferase